MGFSKIMNVVLITVFAIFLSAQVYAEAVKPAIILGHWPAGVDEPTRQQTARCLKAYELYRDGRINTIVVTGGYTKGHISEARMMRIALITYGVPDEIIYEDNLASTTIENGYFSRKLFEREKWPAKVVLISQAGHLWRAKGNFQSFGFRVKNVNADELPGEEDFAPLLKVEGFDVADYKDGAEFAVVYERFDSYDPMEIPTPGLAKRLRAAAALYHAGHVPKIVTYSNWYMRGPVDLSEMMKIALISLGVEPKDIIMEKNIHYGKFSHIEKNYGGTNTLVITDPGFEEKPAAGSEGLRIVKLD